MTLFDSLEPLPPMAKFQLVEPFLADPRPEKILAATGAYKDERGQTPLLQCVRLADERLHARGLPRDYLDPVGYRPFVEAVERLIFDGSRTLQSQHSVHTLHTPGGTAALRLAADLLHTAAPGRAIWVSDPTWGNHFKVFQAAGLTVQTYPYPVADGHLDAPALLEALNRIPVGDVLFLQASTHNPSCVDLSLEQWRGVAEIVARRGLLPFFDVAFFGFTTGISEDLAGMQLVLDAAPEGLVATSFSKSFALYNRRVGSLSVVGSTPNAADNAFSHVQHLIRASYSNPPIDGAAVVAEILGDPELFQTWASELGRMRTRMQSARAALVAGLCAAGVDEQHLSHIPRERGLFTCLNLSADQTDALRTEHAIYLSPPGRLNVTAITDEQRDRFCRAVGHYVIVAPL